MGAACRRRRGLIAGGRRSSAAGRGAAFLVTVALAGACAGRAFAGGRFGAGVAVDEFAGFEVAGAALAGAFLADVAAFFTAGAGFVDFFAAAIARPPPWAQIERRNLAAPLAITWPCGADRVADRPGEVSDGTRTVIWGVSVPDVVDRPATWPASRPRSAPRGRTRPSAQPVVGDDAQVDAIADREVGVATGLLDEADEVAGLTLGLELGGEVDVEHDHAGAPGECGATADRRRRPSCSVNSPGSSAVPAGDDRVAVGRPVARLARP